MKRIKIRKPIWDGMKVGIAEYHLKGERMIEVEILYKTKKGVRMFPGVYCILSEEALKYPIQTVKGVKLRIIPIVDLETVR